MSHYDKLLSFDADTDAIAEWAATLPMRERLELLSDVYRKRPRGFFPGEDREAVFDSNSETLAKLGTAGREWAPRFADELLADIAADHERWAADPAYRAGRGDPMKAPFELRWPIFLSLVRSGIAIEPRWDALLPVDTGSAVKEFMFECARAIPEDRRTAAIIRACRDEAVNATRLGLTFFYDRPSRQLAEFLVEQMKELEPPGKKVVLAALTAAAAKDEDIAALVAAMKKRAPKKIVLTCAKALQSPTLKKLSPEQQKQLRAAGKLYDGKDLPAADRLNTDRQNEQSFLSTLTICELHDSKGKRAYDAFLYRVDSGTIFKASTTKVAAEIMQDSIECENEALADALHEVLKKYRD